MASCANVSGLLAFSEVVSDLSVATCFSAFFSHAPNRIFFARLNSFLCPTKSRNVELEKAAAAAAAAAAEEEVEEEFTHCSNALGIAMGARRPLTGGRKIASLPACGNSGPLPSMSQSFKNTLILKVDNCTILPF